MWKRLLAAGLAVVLAGVGAVLVFAYARGADQRALAGQETQSVLVATGALREGTAVEDLGDSVEVKQVPKAYIVDNAIADLSGLDGQVLTSDLVAGQQLQRTSFSSPEALRGRGKTALPDSAADLHQVTVALEKPRALGGDIAAGDTVGVFMSFDVQGQDGYVLEGDGDVVRQASGEDGAVDGDGSVSISTTHLTLHKVLVARVDGGYVAPASDADAKDKGQAAQDTINVTLAVDAPAAEQLVYAMEFGRVWLSLEPESASEEGTGVVVVTIPQVARDVYQ